MDSPNRLPVFRILGILIAFAAFGWMCYLTFQNMPFLERYYFPSYLRLAFPDIPFAHRLKLDQYTMLYRGVPANGRKPVLALPGDPPPYVEGAITPDRTKLQAWLRDNIYHGKELPRLFLWALVAGGILLIAFSVAGRNLDQRQRRRVNVIRGPHLVSRLRLSRPEPGGFYVKTRWLNITWPRWLRKHP